MSLLQNFVLGSILVVVAKGQADLLTNATGKFAVQGAITRLERARLFTKDYNFMRRVAWIETKDGSDPKTFRDKYHGGIWQVDADVFFDTQTDPAAINSYHPRIASKLNISWPDVRWADLRKPFYSLLAARLHLAIMTDPGECKMPIPSGAPNQAAFYARCYHPVLTTGKSPIAPAGSIRNPQSFIMAVNQCLRAFACTGDTPS